MKIAQLIARSFGTPALALCLSAALTAQGTGLVEVATTPANLDWMVLESGGTAVALSEAGGRPFYAVSRDGGATVATSRWSDPMIRLRDLSFDPLVGVPVPPTGLEAQGDPGLFLVQLGTQVLAEEDRLLEEAGAEVLQIVPPQTRLLRVATRRLGDLTALPFVRAVLPFHPAWKVDAGIRFDLVNGRLAVGTYEIQVTRPGLDEKLTLAAAIAALGGEPAEYISPYGSLLRAELDQAQLAAVLRRSDVLFVDPWTPEEADVDIARQLAGANYLESIEGYAGQGVRGQVRDTALDFSHPDFQHHPPIVHLDVASTDPHGTCVYGIVFGDGTGNPQARGILPEGQGIFHNYAATVDRYVETAQLLQQPFRCVFETNSTGNAQVTAYTTISADMDNILFNNDVVVLQSQSNLGTQSSRPQAWAKNIVSVGGIRHFDTLTTADDAWNAGASIGPAADGRIKPDICFFYDATLATDRVGSSGYTSSNYYSSFGGTSGATPLTAGHVGLIHQMWADGIFGNPLVNWDVFDNKPHATLAKALLTNSASQYPFSGTTADLTRVHQGWGRPDVGRLYDRRQKIAWIDETDPLTNLQTSTYVYTVAPGETEFHATMVYRDPAGNPAAAITRINDLSLRVTSPTGTVYFGNVGLTAGNNSTAGGVANTVDTVEHVIVANPTAGNWTVEIIAADVNSDAYPSTPAIDAAYALVVSGIVTAPPPAPGPGQANGANGALRIRDSLDYAGRKPKNGVNGPFTLSCSAGDVVEFQFEGPAGRPFALFSGPLNPGNYAFPGIGQLDLGLMGASLNFGDIAILMDGINPVTFLDGLANVGPSGRQTLSFSAPAIPPGVLGNFQALFWDVPSVTLNLTAATQVIVN